MSAERISWGGEHRLTVREGDKIIRYPVSFPVPPGWQGGTREQLVNSAEKVLEQSKPSDSRWPAAEWVRENLTKNGHQGGEKKG